MTKKVLILLTSAVLIVGFLLLALVLTGRVYGYGSTEFGNWAMWTAAIATIFAAIGTVSTLIYMIIDSKKKEALQEVRDLEDKKARVSQSYALHKEQFSQLLRDLESTYSSTGLKFTSHYNLYRSLFPMNTMDNLIYGPNITHTTNQPNDDFSEGLANIRYHIFSLRNRIAELENIQMQHTNSTSQVESLLNAITSLKFNTLKIDTSGVNAKSKWLSIHSLLTNSYIVNYLYILSEIEMLNDISNAINHFASQGDLKSVQVENLSLIEEHFAQYIFSFPSRTPFQLNFQTHQWTLMRFLWRAYKVLDNDPSLVSATPSGSAVYMALHEMFFYDGFMDVYIENDDKIALVLQHLQNTMGTLTSQSASTHNKELLTIIKLCPKIIEGFQRRVNLGL